MIVCSCLCITDGDIERALREILSQPDAPLLTPGVVYRHLEKRMVCCGCSTLAVSTIYEKFAKLVDLGFPLFASATFATDDAQGGSRCDGHNSGQIVAIPGKVIVPGGN